MFQYLWRRPSVLNKPCSFKRGLMHLQKVFTRSTCAICAGWPRSKPFAIGRLSASQRTSLNQGSIILIQNGFYGSIITWGLSCYHASQRCVEPLWYGSHIHIDGWEQYCCKCLYALTTVLLSSIDIFVIKHKESGSRSPVWYTTKELTGI